MIISNKEVWVIMSKDRSLIAKGNVRDRRLIPASDVHDNKRLLTYMTKGKAASAMKVSGFYGQGLIDGYKIGDNLSDYLEPVLVNLQLVSDDVGEVPTTWVSCKDQLPEIGDKVEFFTYSKDTGTYGKGKRFYFERTHNNVTTQYDIPTKSVKYWRPAK